MMTWIIKLRSKISFSLRFYSCGTAQYLTKSLNHPSLLANHYIGLTPSHAIKSSLKALASLYLIKVVSLPSPSLVFVPLSQLDSPPLSYPLVLLSIFASGPVDWQPQVTPGPTLSEWQGQSQGLAEWHTNVAGWLAGWLAGCWRCSVTWHRVPSARHGPNGCSDQKRKNYFFISYRFSRLKFDKKKGFLSFTTCTVRLQERLQNWG